MLFSLRTEYRKSSQIDSLATLYLLLHSNKDKDTFILYLGDRFENLINKS